MNGSPQQYGSNPPPPFSYPPPHDPAPPRRTPLPRRGWFVVLTTIVLVGVLSGVLATLLRNALPPQPQPTLSGLDDIGARQPSPLFPGSADPVDGEIGVPARDGDVEFTVTGVECGVGRIGSEAFGTDPVGQFCIVAVDVENVGTAPATVIDFLQAVYDDAGQKYLASVTAAVQLAETPPTFGPMNPGERRSMSLVYDLPTDVAPAVIELQGSALGTPGIRVPLR